MNKPTEAQIKEFWERIADRWESFNNDRHRHYVFGGELAEDEPPIDLNNLFKYAVPNPKIKSVALLNHFKYVEGLPERDGYEASIFWDRMENTCQAVDKDPALALFWAIWEVITANKKEVLAP